MTIYPSGPQDGVKYTLTGQDGNVATFNDPTDANYVGMARWQGLDSADIRESLEDRAGTDGASQGNNYRGRRPVIGSIEILGTSTVDRNQKWQRLKRAANNLRANGTLSWTPDGGAPNMGVAVRLNQPLKRPDESGWLHHCSLALVSADSYIYGTALKNATGSVSPVTVTNQGDGLSLPVIRAVIPAATTVSLQMTNGSTGENLSLPAFNSTNFPLSLLAVWGAAGSSGSFSGPAGSGNGQFSNPLDTAVDSSGNVYVVDSGNHRVQKFNSAGVYQSQFGGFGSSNGLMHTPTAIAIDSTGNLFVVDQGNNRVQKFTSAGAYSAQFGTLGSGATQFNGPTDIAIDGSNNMYITDTLNNRVQKWSSALAQTGTFGTLGSGASNLNFPVTIQRNAAGSLLYVVDLNNSRVQIITTAMAASSRWGSFGTTDGLLDLGLYGIELDSSDNVYLTSSGRLQKFTSAGVFIAKFAGAPGGGISRNSGGTVFYIAGAGGNVVVSLTTTPTVVADFAATSLLASGVNVYSYLNIPASIWWKLQPGDNSILVSGATSWSMDYRDAWL